MAEPLGRPQPGSLGSAVGRGVGSRGVGDSLEAGESGSRGEAALRGGHPWGVSLAGKPFLLFLERRRFPGECKCFPGRLLRLLPRHSSPPLCPAAGPGAPRPSQGRAHPRPGGWCRAVPTGRPRALSASGLGLAGPPAGSPPLPRGWVGGVGNVPFPRRSEGVAAGPPEVHGLVSEPDRATAAAARQAGLLSHCRAPAPPNPSFPALSLPVSFGKGAPLASLVCHPRLGSGDGAGSLTPAARSGGGGRQRFPSSRRNSPGSGSMSERERVKRGRTWAQRADLPIVPLLDFFFFF